MENRYNLLDEQWIPVVGEGKVGLRRIFTDAGLTALGGNPIEKIAVFKLLLAIAQTACTPEDEDGWKALGCDGMRKAVLDYLDSHRDCFWLYGERPFLQMPEIADKQYCSDEKKLVPVTVGNGFFPDLWADNNTVISEYDSEDITYEPNRVALYLITVQSFALRGKQVNNKIKIKKNLPQKSPTANPGPGLGFNKFLHSYILLDSIVESVYLNLLSHTDIKASNVVLSLGTPFWENMPKSEDDDIARESKETLLGHLVPMSRFLYFTEKGIFFTEGIVYHRSKADKKKLQDESSWIDLSISWKLDDNSEIKYLASDVSKRPWRLLTSLLAKKMDEADFQNIGMRIALNKFLSMKTKDAFFIWSGGLDVGSDNFGMKIKENNDYVESEVKLPKSVYMDTYDANFFNSLLDTMHEMNECEKEMGDSIERYLKELSNKKNSDGKSRQTIIEERLGVPKQEFWQLCEHEFQHVVDICSGPDAQEGLQPLYRKFWSFVNRIYDENCPKDTARQREAWAKNRPGIKNVKEER